jgi:hypothetical protein
MNEGNLHLEIDQLAAEIEERIEYQRRWLEEAPEFAPRNARRRRLERNQMVKNGK